MGIFPAMFQADEDYYLNLSESESDDEPPTKKRAGKKPVYDLNNSSTNGSQLQRLFFDYKEGNGATPDKNNLDDTFPRLDILAMLQKPDAEANYPALFSCRGTDSLEKLAGALSSTWRKKKYDLVNKPKPVVVANKWTHTHTLKQITLTGLVSLDWLGT